MQSFRDILPVEVDDNDDDSNPYGMQRSPSIWKARGHGTYEELVHQDVVSSFLELTKHHEKLVVHFCRQNNPDCELMHNHLEKIAKQHLETKFVYVDLDSNLNGAESMRFLESRLGLRVFPTLILVKNRNDVCHLEGLNKLNGKATSAFAVKQYLARSGVLKLNDAEHAREYFEDDVGEAAQTLEAEPEQGAQQQPVATWFDGFTPIVHNFSKPFTSISSFAPHSSVGWGPIPSFEYHIDKDKYDTTNRGIDICEKSSESPIQKWGPYSSFEESTVSGVKTSAPFDHRKLPAATGAACEAILVAMKSFCSKPFSPSKSIDTECQKAKSLMTTSTSKSGGDHRTLRCKLMTCALGSVLLLAVTVTSGIALLKSSLEKRTIHVAFLGDSIQYFNDFPRFMEVLSGDRVVQNSCLHEDATIASLLQTGNGMLKKFNTKQARIEGSNSDIYDFGACSVPQLLLGFDQQLYGESSSSSGLYNDGLNPCIADSTYLSYIAYQYHQDPVHWDFIVINDNMQAPGVYETQQLSLDALKSTYASLLAQTGAIPVFLDTPAFWTTFQNASKFVNVPTFTSVTYEGYRQYAGILGSLLPASQKPLIAPVGIAYLAVWEDNYEMWLKLFHYDEVNPSPHGTFLQGCVVHYTLFGHLPSTRVALHESISSLFSRARRMQPPSHRQKEWPTRDEAVYLYKIAKKVAVDGFLPTSFVKFMTL